jgi:hypothetical protein
VCVVCVCVSACVCVRVCVRACMRVRVCVSLGIVFEYCACVLLFVHGNLVGPGIPVIMVQS